MAKFRTTQSTFQVIPEGNYIFKIVEVDDKDYEDFGTIIIVMQTKDGQKHRERYNLTDQDGNVNEVASAVLSTLYRNAVNNLNLKEDIEVDTDDLVGCYIQADIIHTTSEGKGKNAGKKFTNANLRNIRPALGFKGGDSAPAGSDEIDDELDDLD
ncbi:MAG: hypothetical protein PHC95_12800 [Parabacteroides sp.]|nr:hypothetical protein [Parabacteroides sp.]